MLKFRIVCIFVALFIGGGASAQSSCVYSFYNNRSLYFQNMCDVPIIFSWRTSYGNCANGCGSGRFAPGARMSTSSKTNDGGVRYWVCFYQDWVNGQCRVN